MGVIAYVLLSGLSPFVGADLSDTFDNITGLNYGFDDPEFQEGLAAVLVYPARTVTKL